MKELASFAASLGIGLSLGIIGAGGSILTIPVFVYILNKDPLSSSVYSMFVVGISSLAGSIRSIFNNLVDFNTTLLFGIPSVAGVLIARRLVFPAIPRIFSVGSFTVSKNILFMLSLSSLMFLSAVRMLKPVLRMMYQAEQTDKPSTGLLLLQGLFVGIITGLLGIGGGFLIVPALCFLAKLPVKKAIGTALLIITANSLFSFLNSYATINIDWVLLIKFSLGAIAGILVGTKLSEKIHGDYLKKIFGWFVLVIAFYIVYKQFFL